MLFASLDIHYNESLNTEVQKKNETQIKKLETKVVESMILRIFCNTFFQETSSFPKFSVKKALRKLSSINFNYTCKLHLVVVIRIYFDKNLIYPEAHAARVLIKYKSPSKVSNLLNMFNIKCYIK